MARRSSRGRSASRPRSASRGSARAPVCKPASNATSPALYSDVKSMFVDFVDSVGWGMGWSTGSEFARRAVDAVFGPRTISVVSESPVVAAPPAPATTRVDAGSGACGNHSKAFEDCLNNSGNDIGKCQFYFDMLTECKRNIRSMMDDS